MKGMHMPIICPGDDELYTWTDYAFDWHDGDYALRDETPPLEATLAFFADELERGKLSIEDVMAATMEIVSSRAGRKWHQWQW